MKSYLGLQWVQFKITIRKLHLLLHRVKSKVECLQKCFNLLVRLACFVFALMALGDFNLERLSEFQVVIWVLNFEIIEGSRLVNLVDVRTDVVLHITFKLLGDIVSSFLEAF